MHLQQLGEAYLVHKFITSFEINLLKNSFSDSERLVK